MRKLVKKIINGIIQGALFVSGFITTIIVILMVVFLFREGIDLFGESPVEEGYILALNPSNPVNKLSPEEVKEIFDQNITNWKEVGGKDDSIITFRMDDILNYYSDSAVGENFEHLPEKLSEVVANNTGIIAFLNEKYIDTTNFKGHRLIVKNLNLKDFITGKEWYPTAHPVALMGVWPLILGTLWVSLFAILLALPLGLATAIYMAEVAHPRVRNLLKPIIELLAGIPSVVYGFFGLVIIVPQIQQLFGLAVGETALAGSIILGIMALPTIITVSEDAIRTTPRSMKEASLALGATHWQTIYKVIIPYSISGITAGAILGIGRAIGETMAVLMVTGNAAVIPHSILEPVRTIPATIAAELGEAPQGGVHYDALFALGCILFLITMVVNFTVEFISKRRNQKYS